MPRKKYGGSCQVINTKSLHDTRSHDECYLGPFLGLGKKSLSFQNKIGTRRYALRGCPGVAETPSLSPGCIIDTRTWNVFLNINLSHPTPYNGTPFSSSVQRSIIVT